jgi:hypothetical protein
MIEFQGLWRFAPQTLEFILPSPDFFGGFRLLFGHGNFLVKRSSSFIQFYCHKRFLEYFRMFGSFITRQ